MAQLRIQGRVAEGAGSTITEKARSDSRLGLQTFAADFLLF